MASVLEDLVRDVEALWFCRGGPDDVDFDRCDRHAFGVLFYSHVKYHKKNEIVIVISYRNWRALERTAYIVSKLACADRIEIGACASRGRERYTSAP